MAVVSGQLHLASYDLTGALVRQARANNVVCNNGLTDLATAIGWAGVSDQGALVGATPASLTPLYGAIGTGTDPPYSVTGTTTAGSDTITATSATGGIVAGMLIYGPGMPSHTSVVSTTSDTITLSAPATQSGSGTFTVGTSPQDTALYNEIARSVVSASAMTPSSGNTGSATIWQFQFSVTQSALTLTEAGLYCLASVTPDSGDLLDHALFVPTFAWDAGTSLTLSAQLTWWYQ